VLTIKLALEVSGEAVEAEFGRRLRSMISPRDYKGDLERFIYQVCREFKEEKKNCGQPPRPGSLTWNIPAPRLRANARKGFEKDCLKLDLFVTPNSHLMDAYHFPRKLLDESFDPVINKVEFEIMKVVEKNPGIKVIIFRLLTSPSLPVPRQSSSWVNLEVVPTIFAIEWLGALSLGL
jgi:hypothetical protein